VCRDSAFEVEAIVIREPFTHQESTKYLVLNAVDEPLLSFPKTDFDVETFVKFLRHLQNRLCIFVQYMTNLLIPFECPICGSDGFNEVYVKQRDGASRLTQAYECRGCSTMFRERERFTKHRLTVMGADGIDLKPEFERRKK
jgi:hypothetical protein